MHRAGIVDQVDRPRCRVRVRLPELDELLSGWLQVLQQGTAGRRSNWVPEPGEQVLCLLDEQGDTGFVLGGLYVASAEPPGPQDQVVFDDGTVVSYDREGKLLRVSCAGEVEIVAAGDAKVKAGGKVVLDAPEVDVGEGAAQKMVLGDAFLQLFNQHVQPTAWGASGVPVVPMVEATHLGQIGRVK